MSRPLEIAKRGGANLSRAVRWLVARSALPRGRGVWLIVRLAPSLDEIARPRIPWAGDSPQGLLEVLQTLAVAATDPGIEGVLLRLTGNPIGWSRLLSVRRAVEELRAAGKPVAAYADGLDAGGLLVASAATRVWIPESASVMLVGLRLDTIHLRGLLDHLDVRPDVVRIGSHKTAGERFARAEMSPEEREQLDAYADDLYGELVDRIAVGRGIEAATLRERIDAGPYHARAAVDAGLVDGCLYPDEVERELATLVPGAASPAADGDGVRLVEGAAYHALRASDAGWRPLFRGLPRVAYVVARGSIHRGSGPRGIASDRVRALLERVRKQPDVRGIVLRIESAGGDGVASDLLWRAVSLLRRDKPVVVSMGDVVASGGYYMASAADALFAEKATLTGSIGVVGGKLDFEGLYRRLGIGRDGVERGARAGLLSEARGFRADERSALRETMQALYATFVARVASGRGIDPAAVEPLAQGRVFSGLRACSLGLVDAIGGPLEALREARRRAGLRDDERVLIEIHPRRPQLPGLAALLRLLPGPGLL